ncbi:MAG: hypothetical protein J5J00_13690 [Deltaproteobacteria bacterium]|nr:hypothetical protein [Deltaproteobacteria bacterium]
MEHNIALKQGEERRVGKETIVARDSSQLNGQSFDVTGQYRHLGGRLAPLSFSDVLREIVDDVRVTVRDFAAQYTARRPLIGFTQAPAQNADLRPVLIKVEKAVDNLENLFDELSAGRERTLEARAAILNAKLPLKMFLLDMAAVPEPSSVSNGEVHAVIVRCLELEQEMSARLLQADLAAAKPK